MQGIQRFRQVQAARCIVPYVLLVVCFALDDATMVDVLRESLPALI